MVSFGESEIEELFFKILFALGHKEAIKYFDKKCNTNH